MKAVRYYGIHDVRFEDLPIPTIHEDEVLVKVAYAGICGSDFHIYNRGMFIDHVPETMGHEFVGTVEVTGKNSSALKPGDIVIGNPMVTCGTCEGCLAGLPNTCSSLGFIGEVRPGCFAEYIALPSKDLIRVDCDSAEERLRNLVLSEPLAVVLNLCERLRLKEDQNLAVLGVGPIGLLTILVARKLYGVKSITACGRSAYRMNLAKEIGAEVKGVLTGGRDYDVIVEAAGRQKTFEQAVSHCAPSGKLGIVSIFEDEFTCDLNAIVASQIEMIGCNAYERRHLKEASRILASGRLDVAPLISREFDLTECKDAFSWLNEKEKKAAKVVFHIGG